MVKAVLACCLEGKQALNMPPLEDLTQERVLMEREGTTEEIWVVLADVSPSLPGAA